MIRDTITKIEERLQSAPALSPAARQDLLDLLARLKTEVTELSRTHAEQAQVIAGHAAASATEATRSPQDSQSLQGKLTELSSSVSGFESTHPRLVEIVNRMASALANLGI